MAQADRQATILVTGATGNIGARIIVELLGTGSDIQVIALVRGKSVLEARGRLNANIRRIAPDLVDWGHTRSIQIVCGDIGESLLGLTSDAWESLASSVTHIIHAAASTQWHLPLECARAVNVSGTDNMLKLALHARHAGRLVRYVHLSTAYVCGEMAGTIGEINHSGRLHFANSYEQTKWEAEQKLLEVKEGLPITIIRPSITVGDSQTGLAVTYNVLYPPLKYILTGRLTELHCPPQNRLDLVPVDYVAKAVTHLTQHAQTDSGQIYHLTAGPERSMFIASIVKRAIKLVSADGRPNPKCRFVARMVRENGETRAARRVEALMGMYSSYLSIERHFDDANTQAALRDSGIRLPHIESYLDIILREFIHQEIHENHRSTVQAAIGGPV